MESKSKIIDKSKNSDLSTYHNDKYGEKNKVSYTIEEKYSADISVIFLNDCDGSSLILNLMILIFFVHIL